MPVIIGSAYRSAFTLNCLNHYHTVQRTVIMISIKSVKSVTKKSLWPIFFLWRFILQVIWAIICVKLFRLKKMHNFIIYLNSTMNYKTATLSCGLYVDHSTLFYEAQISLAVCTTPEINTLSYKQIFDILLTSSNTFLMHDLFVFLDSISNVLQTYQCKVNQHRFS